MSNRTYLSDQPAWQRRLAKMLLLIVICIYFLFLLAATGIEGLEICASAILCAIYNIIRSKS